MRANAVPKRIKPYNPVTSGRTGKRTKKAFDAFCKKHNAPLFNRNRKRI